MKNKIKKYTNMIIVIAILVSTMFIHTTEGATPSKTVYESENEITTSAIENNHQEMATFKAKTIKFKKGTWYAYSNGGFYFRINKIAGKKMSYSFHMPSMDIRKKVANIRSSGKTATAKIKCSKGKTHTLTISISGRSIKVKESSSCSKKLLGYGTPNYKKTVIHVFHPNEYPWTDTRYW